MQTEKDLWGLERGRGGIDEPADGFVLEAESPMFLLLAAHHCPTAFSAIPSPSQTRQPVLPIEPLRLNPKRRGETEDSRGAAARRPNQGHGEVVDWWRRRGWGLGERVVRRDWGRGPGGLHMIHG
jgi:hypothetical protein